NPPPGHGGTPPGQGGLPPGQSAGGMPPGHIAPSGPPPGHQMGGQAPAMGGGNAYRPPGPGPSGPGPAMCGDHAYGGGNSMRDLTCVATAAISATTSGWISSVMFSVASSAVDSFVSGLSGPVRMRTTT